MRLWERISQGFMQLWENLHETLRRGFARIRGTLGVDSQGFTRLWERICKDSQDFGRGFARIRKTLGGFARIWKDLEGFMRLLERICKTLREDSQ